MRIVILIHPKLNTCCNNTKILSNQTRHSNYFFIYRKNYSLYWCFCRKWTYLYHV